MRVVKYDQSKHEQEKKVREAELKDAKEAADYYEMLRGDRKFQKYVVEAIFRKSIARMSDNREIGKMIKSTTTKEEIADITMLSIKLSSELEKILSKLLN